jgi:glc operon protein GlcG
MTVTSLPGKPFLTLSAARQALEAAEQEALRLDLRLSIAVVDEAGLLLHFARMDGVHAGTCDVAIAKARTAALFRKPTKIFADALASGGQAILALPNMLPFAGGVPLSWEGAVVGAIGVSGASPDQDAQVAAAGAAIFPAKG